MSYLMITYWDNKVTQKFPLLRNIHTVWQSNIKEKIYCNHARGEKTGHLASDNIKSNLSIKLISKKGVGIVSSDKFFEMVVKMNKEMKSELMEKMYS